MSLLPQLRNLPSPAVLTVHRRSAASTSFTRLLRCIPPSLAETLPDPEQDNKSNHVTKLVVLIRGVKTKPKNRILNTCLILVAQRLRSRQSPRYWIGIVFSGQVHLHQEACGCMLSAKCDFSLPPPSLQVSTLQRHLLLPSPRLQL